MNINDNELSHNRIAELILEFRNDPDSQRIVSYYTSPSYLEILGVSRIEDCHNNFLSWILNPQESHSLSYFPMQKFLEILAQGCGGKIRNENKKLFHSIVTGDISLSDLSVTREFTIDEGRLDLYFDGKVKFSNSTCNIKIIVENKVLAKEHNDQTKKYFNYFNSKKNEEELIFYVFLTPLHAIALEVLEEPECACKEFIQINYQSIVDLMLKPILNINVDNKIKMIIQDYVQSLSKPTIDKDHGRRNMAMAIGSDERELLNKFWNKNNKLIMAALEAISTDPERDEGERGELIAAMDIIKKKAPNFKFHMVGIKVGTVLTFLNHESITCVVLDNNNMVEFEGETLSLSKAALMVWHSLDNTSSSVSGPAYWQYNGERLCDIRERTEGNN